ncbi:hypothetical protein WA158_005710 [Blastocystis sp. Blastoise]
MQRELFATLLGYISDIFEEQDSSLVVTSSCTFLSVQEKIVFANMAQIGLYVKRIRELCTYFTQNIHSSYYSSFCNGIHKYLQEYSEDVSKLEKTFDEYPDQHLIIVKTNLSKYYITLPHLYNFCTSLYTNHSSPISLVNQLYEACVTGVPSLQYMYKLLYNITIYVFTNQIIHWIIYGEISDSFDEFFIISINTVTTHSSNDENIDLQNTFWNSQYVLNEDSVPQFMKNTIISKRVFDIGKLIYIFKRNIHQESSPLSIYSLEQLQHISTDLFTALSFPSNVHDIQLLVNQIHHNINIYVYDNIRGKYDLSDYLTLLRNVSLLGNGMWFESLYIQSPDVLRAKYASISPYITYNSYLNKSKTKMLGGERDRHVFRTVNTKSVIHPLLIYEDFDFKSMAKPYMEGYFYLYGDYLCNNSTTEGIYMGYRSGSNNVTAASLYTRPAVQGFAFILQNYSIPAIGRALEGLGYMSLNNAFVIEFDLHPTASIHAGQQLEPHVSIQYNEGHGTLCSGSVHSRCSHAIPAGMTTINVKIHLYTTTDLSYNLDVYLTDMTTPLLTYSMTLETLMKSLRHYPDNRGDEENYESKAANVRPTPKDTCWVGFTMSSIPTGMTSDPKEVLYLQKWSYMPKNVHSHIMDTWNHMSLEYRPPFPLSLLLEQNDVHVLTCLSSLLLRVKYILMELSSITSDFRQDFRLTSYQKARDSSSYSIRKTLVLKSLFTKFAVQLYDYLQYEVIDPAFNDLFTVIQTEKQNNHGNYIPVGLSMLPSYDIHSYEIDASSPEKETVNINNTHATTNNNNNNLTVNTEGKTDSKKEGVDLDISAIEKEGVIPPKDTNNNSIYNSTKASKEDSDDADTCNYYDILRRSLKKLITILDHHTFLFNQSIITVIQNIMEQTMDFISPLRSKKLPNDETLNKMHAKFIISVHQIYRGVTNIDNTTNFALYLEQFFHSKDVAYDSEEDAEEEAK